MSNRIVQIVRNALTGAGVASQTVTIKKVSDNSTVTSVSSDASGRGEFSVGTVGDPGPIYAEFSDGTNTKRHSGEVVGQVGGFLWVDAINDALLALGVGRVVTGALNELPVSANGSNMLIAVDTGVMVHQDGYVYVREASGNLTIGTADATNPRIDRIILRLTRESQSTRGVCTLMVLAGTPAGSPAAPALTQNSSTWDISLAQVRVDAGVTAIAVGKVTDERVFTLTPPAGTATGDILYVNSSGKLARLPIGSTGQSLAVSSGLPAWGSGGQQITRTAFNDSADSTTNTVTYVDYLSLSITLPAGTWTIEAFAMARAEGSPGIDFRISVDGATTVSSHDTVSTGSGGSPIFVRGSKSGLTTSPKVVTVAYKSRSGGTTHISDCVLVVTAYQP